MTTDGKTKTEQDSLQATGRTSPDKVSPSTTEKSYTEAEIAQRHSKLDKAISDLTKERDAFRKDLEATKASLDEIQRRKEEEALESARGNPELLNSIQEKKRLREERETIAQQRKDFEAEKLAHQIEIEEAREVKKEIEIFDIAQEFEGGDAEKLKKLCATLQSATKEQIRDIAETLWEKKGKEKKETKGKHDSGVTIGGSKEKLGDLPPSEMLKAIQKTLRK